MAEQDQDDNIVSIAEARRKQKVIRKGANGKDPQYDFQKKSPSSGGRGGSKIWFYLQFILFLIVLGYFMQKCRGG